MYVTPNNTLKRTLCGNLKQITRRKPMNRKESIEIAERIVKKEWRK